MPYSDEQRISAVEIILRHGGMTLEAIAAIRLLLAAPGLSKSTLHGWVKELSAQIEPSNRTEPNQAEPVKKPLTVHIPTIVQETDEALDMLFENVARLYLSRAKDPDKLEKASAKDLVTAAAIATDKMRLLRNLPTEIVVLLPDLVEVIKRKGADPTDMFAKMKAKFDALPDAPMVTESHGAN